MVFFQYWVTFFSTIFIVYFYINIYKLYGTSDFYIIQFICSSNNHYHNNMESFNSRILAWTFLMSVLFKLGITPLHLFKVEVYKGLPFISIFFYTVYYFTIFFIFFIFFLNDFLFFLLPQYYLLLVLIILIGIIYVIILLFDVTFLKVFFTYSTIINSIAFLIAFISCL